MTSAAFVVAASATVASGQGMGPANLNPWQECGIGSMVFPDNGTASAISNVIWDLGTTAVSSALSSPEQCQGASVCVAAFVQMTHDHLSTETAIGDGEYLRTLVNGINYDPSIQVELLSDLHDEFAVQLQDASYAEKDHDGKAETYFIGLRDVVSADYAESCDAF